MAKVYSEIKITKLFLFILIIAIVLGYIKGTKKNIKKNMLIPFYIYDKNLSNILINSEALETIIIYNPSNGPGLVISEYYYKNIENSIKNNKIPIGYIHTSFTNENIELVKEDIDKWLELYPDIKGFFIDEVKQNNAYEYYKELFDYIKSLGDYIVVLNPGTKPQKEYFDISDIIVVFENSVLNYNNAICDSYSEKSALIIYEASKDDMNRIINSSKCKYIYITDDVMPNPYDTLPTYFNEEIELLK